MINILLLTALIYLIAGFVFALWFAFRLVDHFDEQAKGASVGFRMLIIPGTVLLWPYLLRMYLKKRKQ
jgi:hypothetical protein